MSAPERFEIPSDPPPPSRRRKRLLLGVLALLVLGLALSGYYAYLLKALDWELTEALAEVNRTDPGWRLEELEARRQVLPEDENAAVRVLAVKKQLPESWPPMPDPAADPDARPSLGQSLADLDPEEQLAEWQSKDLRAELQKVLPALAAARQLVGLRQGRYTMQWPLDHLGMDYPCQAARTVVNLLQWDAILRAHDRDIDGALASCRAALNAGRSIGDEPSLISQLVRLACEAVALRSLERTLAQGEASEAALAAIQELLQLEAAEPLQLIAYRGERALGHRMIEAYETGELRASKPAGAPSSRTLGEVATDFGNRLMMRRSHPPYLRTTMQFVEIAKLPFHEQAPRLQQVEATKNQLPVLVALLVPAMSRVASGFQRNQAMLRCALVAVALERYRLAHGRWPETLAALTPGLLRQVPLDPFDGAPLRYRRLDDGVVVYALGPDGDDNGGTLDRQDSTRAGADLGFRLWDVAQRGQPAKPPDHATNPKDP